MNTIMYSFVLGCLTFESIQFNKTFTLNEVKCTNLPQPELKKLASVFFVKSEIDRIYLLIYINILSRSLLRHFRITILPSVLLCTRKLREYFNGILRNL